MNKYKYLLFITLKELNLTPKELNEVIEKYGLDEHLSTPLKYFYKKTKNKGQTFDKKN